MASTFIGGSYNDNVSDLAIDSSGNVFIAGYTYSNDYPVIDGAYDTTFNDVFISKLDDNLSSLLSSTFIGGSSWDGASAIVIDSSGNVIIAGYTSSSDYPTTEGAYNTTFDGSSHAIISILDSDLSNLLSSTFIGGSSWDRASALAIDSSGNVIIAGRTWSSDYPTTEGAFDTTYNGGYHDVFISKLDDNLSSLLSSTFIGGSDDDDTSALAIGSSGNVIIAGYTRSSDYPTTGGAFDPSFNGSSDVFVTKLDSDLSSLLSSTFIGGSSWDGASAFATDSSGNVIIAGYTSSSDYPTTGGAFDPSFNGDSYDVFISKLDSSLSSLLSSTFIGGNDSDSAGALAIDSSGNVFVAGSTGSSDYPTTGGAFDTSFNDSEGFISKLDSSLSSLLSSTFIGGSSRDGAHALAIDSSGNVIIAGTTYSEDYPTTDGAYDTTYNGVSDRYDVFISKFDSYLCLSEDPYIVVTPSNKDFGSVDAGSSSASRTFTVSNSCKADLVISGVYLTGANPSEFSIQNENCSGRTLALSESCTVEAAFTPAKAGEWSAFIGIESNDPLNPTHYTELTGSTRRWLLTQAVDAPKYITTTSSRAIVIDKHGNTHIAYGGDHLYHAYQDGNEWVYETVDSSPNVGGYAAIALDSAGNAHISYYDALNRDLKYATNASGSWVTETVDSAENTGINTSIAVDSSDKIHISYHDSTNYDLKYATNASGSWITETIASTGDRYIDVYDLIASIAIDSSDNVHISYIVDRDLKYATNASGSWVTETVVYGNGGGFGIYFFTKYRDVSIAIDSTDKAHISYVRNSYDGSDYIDVTSSMYYELQYATNATGSWVTEILDGAGGSSGLKTISLYTSIAVDSRDKVHISYAGNAPLDKYAEQDRDLKYATNASGSWVTETLESEGDVGLYTSISIDSGDKAHISYLDNSYHNYETLHNDLKYATNATGSWVTGTVDRSRDAGMYNSIAVDSSNNAHISYNASDDLNYATNASGSWVSETIDSSGDVVLYTSIAVDSSGNVHISYYDYTNTALKYATNATGSWVTEIVDENGYYTSIAVDSLDNVHISYNASGDLKYAANATGSWVTEIVDENGYYTSIAVDSLDNVHISYISGGDLKYAANTTGSWVTESIDSEGYVSKSSIAIDSADKVHISYFDSTNEALKYATNASGSWITETVGSSGYLRDTSIAVDSLDNVHISYYGFFTHDLRYVTNISGYWVTEIIDDNGWVGEFNSIAVDSSDNVHISYYDSSNRDLKYVYIPGPRPDITASPTSYDFGSVHKKKSSPPATFTISNTGTADLVIGGVYLTGTDPYQFSIQNDNCSDQTIASSGSCTIEAIFSPTKKGTFNALIGIDSNDPDTPALYMELTGTGVMGHKKKHEKKKKSH